MDFNPVLPTSLDALHLLLAVVVLILLLFLILRAGRKTTATPVPPAADSAPAPAPKPEPPVLQTSDPVSALQLLGLLQQEARFVDFLQEDLKGFDDAEIGAVARVVHEGAAKLLGQYFTLEPVRSEQEETRITLEPGFDPAANRVTGNVVGEPPFSGTLVHRGWRASRAELPRLASHHDVRILAPAEVEL
ncbi:MAG: DUF2760 domain-containing protein [Pseudomonadota bacterium]|nr:hypothetical protein [Pseudomonadales bacterium]MDY6918760.1 DUF2760 domain-containing protein [Pseudomonadota bacterium]